MAQPMTLSSGIKPETKTSLVQAWQQQLAAHHANCEANCADKVLRPFRENALDELSKSGRLPGRKDEHWKYFSLQSLEASQPELNLPRVSNGAGMSGSRFGETGACRLPVRLGDRFDLSVIESGCLPKGVRLLDLAQALDEPEVSSVILAMLADENLQGAGRVFQALNTAALGTLLDNSLVVHVASDTDAGRLHIEWLPAASDLPKSAEWLENSRVIIILENGASLQLLESFSAHAGNTGEDGSILNQVTQVSLGENSRFDHLRVQMCAANQHLFQTSEVRQGQGSEYRYTGFELGGGLVRNELVSRLNGEGAFTDLAGAFVGKGESCVDHHLLVDHQAPGCRSEQNFRGVLGDRSKGVFNGKALIRPGADGSSVRQSNANLLLSDLAEMNTKPELEIYADEVEASHGATVGQLDDQALFYLQSRGLAEEDARRMLTGAFCRAIGARLSDRQLVEQIEALLDAAMPEMSEPSEEAA